MRNERRLAAVILSVLLHAGGSYAQTGDARAQAREAFLRGVSLMDERNFRGAIQSFEASYQLRPLPVVLPNLALAYRGAGRFLSALETLQRYLNDPTATMSTAERRRVENEVRELRDQLAPVEFRIEPAEARSSVVVMMDGREVNPMQRPLFFDPGQHQLEVEATGFRPHRRLVSLISGQRTELAIQLEAETTRPIPEPPPVEPPRIEPPRIEPPRVEPIPVTPPEEAHLVVTSELPGALVIVDQQPAQPVPYDQVVSPGPHQVTVRAAGYEPQVRTIQVAPGARIRIQPELLRVRSETPRGTPGWVVPTVVVGGLAVAGGVTAAILLLWPAPIRYVGAGAGWQGNFPEVR